MKDIKTTQPLDFKVRMKQILQFAGREEMKGDRNTVSVAELDLTSVQMVVELEVSGAFDRIDEHGGCAAYGAHGGNEMPLVTRANSDATSGRSETGR